MSCISTRLIKHATPDVPFPFEMFGACETSCCVCVCVCVWCVRACVHAYMHAYMSVWVGRRVGGWVVACMKIAVIVS